MRSQELALTQTRNTNLRDLNQAETDLAKASASTTCTSRWPNTGSCRRRRSTTPRTTSNYQHQRLRILKRSVAQTEALQTSQLRQLRAASSSLNSSMGVARSSLGQLNIRAPVTGELSGFDVQLGQSLQQGERIGQIDSAGARQAPGRCRRILSRPGRVGRRRPPTSTAGPTGSRSSKVYPQVRNGQFQIDLVFDGPAPASVQRGQTVQTKLTSAIRRKALLIPNGAFFNDTGGNWVFVVDTAATARPSARSSSAAATPISSKCSSGL